MGPGAPAPAAVVRQRHGPHRRARDRRRPHPRPRRADRHGGGRGARGDRLVRHRLRGQARRGARHPGRGADVFLLHVEATDEAGHAGNLDEKVKALEAWDTRILDGLVEGLDALGPWRLLLLPDHPTPVALRTHTTDPVPYLLVDSADDGPGGTYSEAATAGCTPVPGHEMLGRLLAPDLARRHRPPAAGGASPRVPSVFRTPGCPRSVAPFCRGATVSSGRVTGQPPTPSQCEVVPLRTGRSATRPGACLPAYPQRSTDPVSPEAVR